MAQCSHRDQRLDCGQLCCEPLPAITGVVTGEQFRTGGNHYGACIIDSDLPHHDVKLRGQALLQTHPCSPPSSLRYRAAFAPWRQLGGGPAAAAV